MIHNKVYVGGYNDLIHKNCQRIVRESGYMVVNGMRNPTKDKQKLQYPL